MIVKNSQCDLVAAGHICLDLIPEIPDTSATGMDQIFRPGAILNVGPCVISTGGPVSNTGLGAERLGCKVAFMAKVGQDAYGQVIRQLLEKAGSSDGIKTTSRTCSSYTVALAPPGIDRMFLHCPGANDTFTSEDIAYDLVAKAAQFHLGYPPLMKSLYQNEGEQLTKVFRRAKEVGATTSLDMSLPDPASPSGQAPWLKILANVLPYVDIFLPSMEEAFFMLHPQMFMERKRTHGGSELLDYISPDECSECGEAFLDMGACMTALKSGHRGYYFRTKDKSAFERMGRAKLADPAAWSDREIWCPAYQINTIASATGSGDSSIAGFLTALLRGLSLEECLKVANCVGNQNLQGLDALSGIKTWDETWAMVNADDQPIIDPKLGDCRWRRDERQHLWYGPADASA